MKSFYLLIEASLRLARHDLFMRHHSFADLCERLRTSLPLGTPPLSDRDCIDSLASSVDLACLFYPKRVLCLQRAAVLCPMLRQRGVKAQFVVGIQQTPFRAHAWVEVGGAVVNDTLPERESFQVLEVC